ncbi:MAG: class I SAM-dependent methyltransferase [Burkholderiales bacterium]|nr:class I SAM-dependent methyltransferase [Burkholderiales bacterium]
MFLENRLEKLVDRLRDEQAIPLRLKLWTGRTFELGPQPTVTVALPRASALRYFVAPDLMKLGEAYVEGRIDVDGSLKDVFEVGELFARKAASPSKLVGIRRAVSHSPARDRKAIQYHYDVSNEFYALFLGRDMVYSCAYFRRESDDLDLAQEQKLDHILNKLQLKPGERLLDIGCGWGALVMRAAKKYGALATGITLSQNQHKYASRRIKEEGLEGRCEVRLQDYRDVPGEQVYDKIASIGMFEHVGLRNLHAYFAKVRALLRDGGLVLNHGITSVDPDSRSVGLGAGEFINRYVFPHGELPHIGLVLREMSHAGLDAVDVESLRRHYARTTEIWANRLERAKARAIELAGDKRYRIWSVYLQGCSYGFAQGWMTIHQVLACKQGGPQMNRLPLTREYMYAPG